MIFSSKIDKIIAPWFLIISDSAIIIKSMLVNNNTYSR